MQARPNGRIIDHTRIVLGGTEMVNVKIGMRKIFNSPALEGMELKFSSWPGDIQLRRNTTSSDWIDVIEMLEAREATVVGQDDLEKPQEEVLEMLEMPGGSRSVRLRHAAAIRWATKVGVGNTVELVLESLPESARFLNSKPIMRR
jgi:hypothetical protein